MKKLVSKSEIYPVYLPVNFDADALLAKEKMNITKRTNLKAAMYYILNTIHHMSLTREWRDYFEEYGGYPLHSDIMGEMIGDHRYVDAFELLVKHGVIERSTGYQLDTRSKLVRLTGLYASADTKVRQLPIDATFYEKILQKKHEHDKKVADSLESIPYITKWFDPAMLSVDVKMANSFIEFYRDELVRQIPVTLPAGKTLEEINSRINNRVNNLIDTMNSFLRGEMRLTKTGKDNRLHSFMSNTKKELRTLYTFKSKSLVSIDLKSSQPYLLTYMLNPENLKKELKSINSEALSGTSTTIQDKEDLAIILMSVSFEGLKSKTILKKGGFASFSWKDDFYAYLVDKAKQEGKPELFPDRDAVKKQMMMILFDDGAYKDYEPSFKLFSKWFPEEAELILYIKGLSRELKAAIGKDNLKKYPDLVVNLLPGLLQRLESRLLLDEVCAVISKELPDAPLLPVHDCVHTTPEYAEDVKIIMERELTRLTGIVPGIKVEAFSHNTTMRELSKLAANDMDDILNKKRKKKKGKFKSPVNVSLKSPVVYETPVNGKEWLINSRYHEASQGHQPDSNERTIRLIDDINE